MQVFEAATGDCVVCGESAEGSLYWTPLPTNVWNAVRPFLAPLFQDEDHIQNVMFIEGESEPFCGAVCSSQYHKEKNDGKAS